MNRDNFDLSVYLVTNADMVPPGIDFLEQVERAIAGGVTIVQLREKELETRAFIERAKAVHKLTQKAGIPLLINDRVDVALAVGCEGVHVGQDDMPVPLARELLGPDKIIGVSTSYVEEVEQAVRDKADYIGIGAVFPTNTKKLKKVPFGTEGVRRFLATLKEQDALWMKTCVIGGINASNLQRVNLLSAIPEKRIDGYAVVSCIMAQQDAKKATVELVETIKALPAWVKYTGGAIDPQSVKEVTPMVHHITNDVVKNFSANVTLAAGGSPIMSECPEEFAEFARIPHTALVLNTGTPTEEQVHMYLAAIEAYNQTGAPIVYDPVGAGASDIRRNTVRRLLNSGYFTVIKGNLGEISTVAGVEASMKGVDSIGAATVEDTISIATQAALANKCVVCVTGATDVIVNGMFSVDAQWPTLEHVTVEGGHPMMGKVTGSGCSLGSAIAVAVAANPHNAFAATVQAVRNYKEAGRRAAIKASGSGSFVPFFIDELTQF